MTDQISFLPMLEPRDTSFEDNERKASQICDEAFHNAYLRLTGYTEQEYRKKLKQESQTVYAARVASGIYQEA